MNSFSVDRQADRLPAAPPSWEGHIHWHERLGSTNAFLKEWVERERDVPFGTVVAAREQTQGRGRRDRTWVSGARENLAVSLWLRGAFDPRESPSSGMAAALAVADYLGTENIPAALKWPNDVQVNRKKICGILSERLAQGLVIGIGLNVNMKYPDRIDQPATSMRVETGRTFSVDRLLVRLLDFLEVRIDQWRKGGFSVIRSDWESRSPDLGRSVSVRDGTRVRDGVLHGFGAQGELLLRGPDGRIQDVWAGDVGLYPGP